MYIYVFKNSYKYKLTRALILNERRIARLSKFMFYIIQNYLTFKPEIWCLLNMNIYHLWWFISYDDDYYHSIYNLDHLDGKIYE